MHKLFIAILSSASIYAACGAPTYAADYRETRRPRYQARVPEPESVWIRAGGDCERRLCALDTSIFSLYGSYGPEGGPSYWGAYTAAGWGDGR
jgi:hypothetical protein